MRILGLFGTFVGAMLMAGVANADSVTTLDAGDSYLYFGASYLLPDNDRNHPTGAGGAANIDDGVGINAAFGWRWTESLWWEVQANTNVLETKKTGGSDFYNTQLGVDLMYAFGDRTSFTPFALVGIGAAYNDVFPDDDDAVSAFGNVGLGFVTAPIASNGLRLRAEARYIFDSFESGSQKGMNDARITVGVEIPLNRTRVVTREHVKIVEKPVQVPVKVEVNKDSDGDGVIDSKDKCPDTIKGAKVNGDGCVEQEQKVTVLKGVHFAFDSAELTLAGQQLLEDSVQAFKGQPDLTAVIEGNADSIGSDQYNMALSLQRALAVQSYLVGHGVDKSRLSAKGLGESNPIAPNTNPDGSDNPEGRALNRRVDFDLSSSRSN